MKNINWKVVIGFILLFCATFPTFIIDVVCLDTFITIQGIHRGFFSVVGLFGVFFTAMMLIFEKEDK